MTRASSLMWVKSGEGWSAPKKCTGLCHSALEATLGQMSLDVAKTRRDPGIWAHGMSNLVGRSLMPLERIAHNGAIATMPLRGSKWRRVRVRLMGPWPTPPPQPEHPCHEPSC